MTRAINENIESHDVRTSGTSSARRALSKVLFGLFITFGVVIILLIISNYAEAGDYGVEIRHNTPSNGISGVTPGVDEDYTVDVINTGDLNPGEDIWFNVSLNPAAEAAGWTVTPDGSMIIANVEMGEGNKKVETVTIRAPSDAEYQETATVDIFVEVIGHSGEVGNQDSLQLRANVIQVFSVLTGIQDGDSQHDVNDGDITIFNFTINNTGNGEDTFLLSYSGLPIGWDPPSFETNSVVLEMGAEAVIDFQVNVPQNAESKYYTTIKAIATSLGSSSKSSDAAVSVHVLEKYKVSIQVPPPTSMEEVPGSQIDFQVTVSNTGNIGEDFQITYIVIEGESWSMGISIGATPFLEYQENTTFTFSVTIDSDALDSHYSRVEMKVASVLNPAANASVILTANVAQTFGVSVSSPVQLSTDPGETVWFMVDVRNTGNGVDSINIEATAGGVPNETILVDMLPNEIRTINVTVNVDSEAPAGIMQIQVNGTSDDNPAITDFGTIQVDVNEAYEITLVVETISKLNGYPGGAPIVFQVRVTNAGTGTDTFHLDLTGQKPTWGSIVPATVSDLAPGAFRIVNVTVTVPANEPVNIWYINVTGESNGDNASTGVVDLRVDVQQIFDVSISIQPNSIEGPAGGVITYDVSVKNKGTGYDDFIASVWAEDPQASTWASTSPAIFGLASFDSRNITVTVNVPESAAPGSYVIWVNVTSENDTTVVQSKKTISQVTQSYEVLIAGGKERSGESPPESVITYVVEIYNTGTGDDSFAVERIDAQSNHPSWSLPSTNFTGVVGPGQKFVLYINVSIPLDVGGDTLDYVLYRVYSQGDSDPPAEGFVWLNTTITPERSALIVPHKTSFNRIPGDILYVTVQVTNTGSATDTFTLEDITSVEPYDSWGEVPLPATVVLADINSPGNTTMMTYIVTIPTDVTRDESPIKMFLAINSTGFDGIIQTREIIININQTFGVRLSSNQNTLLGDPGETVSFSIKVTNQGNGNDTFSLDDIGDESGIWSSSDVELTPSSFGWVTFNVSIPAKHDTNDILLTLIGTSLEADIQKGLIINDTLELTIEVNPYYDVKLDQNGGNRKDGISGQVVYFNLLVTNEGTALDDFEIDVDSPSGFSVTLSDPTIEIESVVVDPLNSTLTVNISVRLRSDPLVPIGEYLIVITATSLNDDPLSPVNDTFTFYIDVKATYLTDIFSTSFSESCDAGQSVTFPIQVNNDGNEADQYTFDIIGMPVGWTHSTLSIVQVPAGGPPGSFDLTVDTTDNSAAAIYNFTLTAVSDGDSSQTDTILLTVEVNQVYIVDLPGAISSKSVDVDNTVTYSILVRNQGNGVDNIELRLTGADATYGNLYYSPSENGQTIHISPPTGGSLTVLFNVTPPLDYHEDETGDIQITIEAESLDDPAINPETDDVTITTLVNDVYEFIVSGVGSKSNIPGETETFALTILNDGSTGDTFNLKVLEIRTDTGGTISYWESANTNPFSVNPVSVSKGGQQTVDVDIDIPYPDPLSEIPPGEYIIEVEIKSTGDPDIIQTVNYTVRVKQLYAAEIVNTISSQNVDVGSYVTYTLQVKNMGNRVDNISIEIEDDGIITGDQTSWTSVTYNGQVITNINLDAGDVAWVQFNVSIPLRTDPGYPSPDPLSVTFPVTVAPSKPNEPGAEKEEIDILTNINPIYEFRVNPITKQADEPGVTVEFSIRIQNEGTGSDTYTPEMVWLIPWDQFQTPPQFSPESLILGPGQTGTITLFFTIPSDNDKAVAGEYNNSVTISSENTDEQTLDFTVEVEEVYGLELTDPATLNKAVTVGNAVTYQFKIKNTGNSQDTFVLDKIDEDPSSTGGGDQSSWASFVIASDPGTFITSVILGAEESETVIFTIDVPLQTDPNFVELTNALEMTVLITSEGGTSLDEQFTTTTTVDPIYSFELSTTDDQKDGEPGDTITFTLQVRNSGTSSDSYNFRVTSIDESIFPGTVDPNDISNLNVDSFGTTSASFDITDDKSKALYGSYDIEITSTSSNDPGVTEIIILTVDITPLAAVEMTPSSQQDNGEPEEEIDYSIQVRNKGNDEDTFELTLSGTNKDWGEILDSNENPITEVTLSATTLPGSFANIIVRVTIPGTGETKADQTYPITLKAASTNTENVFDEAQVNTRVQDFVDLELAYSGGGTPDKDFDPNKKSPKFSFRATNNGNQDESSVEIRVDDIDGEWDYTPKTLPDTLDPGGSTTFSLEFTIPTDAPEGDYDMQVVVVSSVDPAEESDPVIITVSVIKPDLVISSGDISGLEDPEELKNRVGSQVTIIVTVRNKGTSMAESVQVKLYEGSSVKGTTSISSLEPDGYENITFRWKVVAEEVDLKIEAIPLEESNEGNNGEDIYLDLRPDFSFEGEEINFSDPTPDAKDKITITAYIRNTGGDAEDITVTFSYGGKNIGTDTVDIAYDDTGEASVEWDVPDKAGDSLTVEVEVEHPDAPKDEKSSKSVKVASTDEGGVAGVFTGSGLIGMGIGLAIGAILFLLIGMAVGRRSGGKGPQGMAAGGPGFAAFDKQMAEGADKKAPKGPVPFERTDEEGAPPAAASAAAPAAGVAEEDAAKPKEVARVRCPKCGKVTEVTSTQRPLQIPCECGTTLMLKK